MRWGKMFNLASKLKSEYYRHNEVASYIHQNGQKFLFYFLSYKTQKDFGKPINSREHLKQAQHFQKAIWQQSSYQTMYIF